MAACLPAAVFEEEGGCVCWCAALMMVHLKVKRQDHFTCGGSRDDQTAKCFLYLVQQLTPCWLSQASSPPGPL